MNAMLVTSIFIFALISAIYWFMPYATPKSIQFGVRIPRGRETDPAIASARKAFHRIYLTGSVILFILFIVIPWYAGISYIALFSLVPLLLFSYLNYFRTFRILGKMKRESGWYENETENIGASVDGMQTGDRSYTGILTILPSIAIIAITVYIGITLYPTLPALIPTHFGANGQANHYSTKSVGTVFLLVFIQIAVTTMMAIIGYFIVRTRQETDISRPRTSSEQQVRFKEYTRDALYLFNSMIMLTMLFSSLEMWQVLSRSYALLITLVPVLAGTVVLVIVMMSFGQMGSRLPVHNEPGETTGKANRNDDRDWKGGAIYYNRNDPSILVGKRFGVGWTFNFSHIVTWIILALLVALPIIIILIVRLHLL